MSNVSVNTNELKFELNFADGDTRTFRLKNPLSKSKADWSTAITEINNLILTNNLLIGDKNGGAFTGIYRVTVINKTETYLDLS